MSRTLPWIYLTLAVLGAILPWQANLEFMQSSTATGFDIAGFITDANLTAASRSLSRDLLIAASAFSIWIVLEGRRLDVKGWRLTLLACVTISFACGGPLFLYLRERRLNELAAEGSATSPEQSSV
ncbi:MAG: DUF2834 domain-containing protein [Synechococcus sp. BS307-5m-G39]|nr:DUF2834 domain-containing protein [Synechococcus sp. BS307-5m-G39]